MRNFITPIGEEYPFGGPGKFILGTVQAVAERLRQEYANTVDLIYIDPPFGTGDGFSVKLPAQAAYLALSRQAGGVSCARRYAHHSHIQTRRFRI